MASEQGSAALNKSAVATPRAPTAIGPYTQAIRGNGQLFVSGMIGLDSDSGKLVSDDVQEQAREALNNLKAVVEAGGTTLEAIVSVPRLYTWDPGIFRYPDPSSTMTTIVVDSYRWRMWWSSQ
eukprot:gb/GECG01009641.1/.p1 GENE.gb/GECG01009641.1/~~gb/GECG01009641.1/.p1  ORF type:complete len:123 (+),score=13.25 gb/GECG01009641.1/:1-369(+)